jgi:hypothetical protein
MICASGPLASFQSVVTISLLRAALSSMCPDAPTLSPILVDRRNHS